MIQWLLPVLIFVVWYLWIVACAAEAAVVDARNGIAEGKRRGVSILPGIPVFPLAFWGIAWGLDWFFDPWGTILIGAFHAVYGVVLVVTIVRSTGELRAIDGLS